MGRNPTTLEIANTMTPELVGILSVGAGILGVGAALAGLTLALFLSLRGR